MSRLIFFIGCDLDVLLFVGAKSCEVTPEVNIHPHLRKTFCEARMAKLQADSNIDWASAEALAFGSLLYQGKYTVPFYWANENYVHHIQ